MRRDRISRRRFLVLAMLVAVSAFGMMLLALRPAGEGEWKYEFLAWNLFLAWVPFVLALVLYDAYQRGLGVTGLVLLGAGWLLFLPNAPYLVTDLVHLRGEDPAPVWFNALTLVVFGGAGLMLGIGSLALVQSVVTAARGRVVGWGMCAAALVLSSVGIYLGRVLNLNSWDAIVDPLIVLGPFVENLRDVSAYLRVGTVTIVLSVMLAAAYVVLYPIARRELALVPQRRRTR